jgi:hypothetical protein
MSEKKIGNHKPTTMAHDNHRPEVIKKNFVPETRNVQGNHVPTTNEKPSTPPPNPKKK